MDNWIIAIFTVLATICSIIALARNIKNDAKQQEIEKKQDIMQNELKKMEQGKTELQINELIGRAKRDLLDISLKIHNEELKDINSDIKMAIYNSYIELELCAYDEACSLYIDNKLDKERFKKNYQVEIRNLFETDEIKEKLDSVNSKYYCLLKVYKEWENPEL